MEQDREDEPDPRIPRHRPDLAARVPNAYYLSSRPLSGASRAGLVPRAADFPVYQERGGTTRSNSLKNVRFFSQLRFKARDIGGLRRSRNRKRPIDKLGFPCYNGTISSFALIETHVSRLPAFVKWCLSCAILEGLRGTNGVADSVSSASCGRPATGPAAAAAQNFGALAVHSLNDQGDLRCHGQVGEVSCAFL